MELKVVKIENPDGLNLILGQSHFIKTVEDISEAMVNTVPMAKFGLAFPYPWRNSDWRSVKLRKTA